MSCIPDYLLETQMPGMYPGGKNREKESKNRRASKPSSPTYTASMSKFGPRGAREGREVGCCSHTCGTAPVSTSREVTLPDEECDVIWRKPKCEMPMSHVAGFQCDDA
jgi:hypothetical protein